MGNRRPVYYDHIPEAKLDNGWLLSISLTTVSEIEEDENLTAQIKKYIEEIASCINAFGFSVIRNGVKFEDGEVTDFKNPFVVYEIEDFLITPWAESIHVFIKPEVLWNDYFSKDDQS